jgi:hypothetical protein
MERKTNKKRSESRMGTLTQLMPAADYIPTENYNDD